MLNRNQLIILQHMIDNEIQTPISSNTISELQLKISDLSYRQISSAIKQMLQFKEIEEGVPTSLTNTYYITKKGIEEFEKIFIKAK